LTFVYSNDGEEKNIQKFVELAKHVPANDFVEEGEDECVVHLDNPLPLFFIGSFQAQDNVIFALNRLDETWFVHMVYYQPRPQCGF